ncbi:CoA transferase [Pseudochelatococcus sp. B33]
MATSAIAGAPSWTPLTGIRIVERFGGESTELGIVAVSFAGTLASRLGATVFRALDPSADPLRHRPPRLPDGTSALFRFLTSSKIFGEVLGGSDHHYVLTDDAGVASSGATDRVIHVKRSFDAEGGSRPQSELTIQAVAGLLDIMGEEGRPPLPLPGNQAAYTAGLAAFNALLAVHLSELLGRPRAAAQVGIAEAATWVNWKHQLDSVSNAREAGREQRDEWVAMPCADGFIAVVYRDGDIQRLAELIGDPRLAAPEFRTRRSRQANLVRFQGLVADALRTRTKADIATASARLRLPLAPVVAPHELAEDEQMIRRGFFAEEDGSRVPRLPLLWRGPTASDNSSEEGLP